MVSAGKNGIVMGVWLDWWFVGCVAVVVLLVVSVVLAVRRRTVGAVAGVTGAAVVFAAVAWNYMDLVQAGMVFAVAGIVLAFAVARRDGQRGTRRWLPVVALLVCLMVVGAVIAAEGWHRHEADGWVDGFRDTLMAGSAQVVGVEIDPGRPGLGVTVSCRPSTTTDETLAIVRAIKEYLFDNPSGRNPSLASYTQRGQGGYDRIYVWFTTSPGGGALVDYESGYYAIGTEDRVDNYTTWLVDHQGVVSSVTIP